MVSTCDERASTMINNLISCENCLDASISTNTRIKTYVFSCVRACDILLAAAFLHKSIVLLLVSSSVKDILDLTSRRSAVKNE